MAEQMFMFATTAGFMIGLGVLLFIVRVEDQKARRLLFQVMRMTREEKLRNMIRMANPFMNKNLAIDNPHTQVLAYFGAISRLILIGNSSYRYSCLP